MSNLKNQLAKRSENALAVTAAPYTLDQSEQWDEIARSSGFSRSTSVGLWALALGFGGFLLWATLAPLDEGVPSSGTIAIETKRKPVQHLTGGIVREVLVREGDIVKEGQVLVRLDDAASRSNYETLYQHYLNLRAMQARLEAENRMDKSLQFHPDLIAAKNDPLVQEVMQRQIQLFASRQDGLEADLRAFEENIQGQKGTLKAQQSNVDNRRQQLALLKEELGHTRQLVKEGYTPRNRQLELERMVAESSNALSDLLGNITRTTSSISEITQRSIARRKEYKKEVESQLADVVREAQADALKLRVARDDLTRIEIKSPVGGQVMGLAIQAPGSVLQAGQKLLDIVPEKETLLIEAHVSPGMIDKVHAGLPVDIRFAAFAHSPQLLVQGQVVSVSKDVSIEPQGGAGHYLARVAVTPEGLKTLGPRQMQPGMQVEVVFKTGERTLLDYLLHPLTKRMSAAMKEE